MYNIDLIENKPTEPALGVMWFCNYVAARNPKIMENQKIHLKMKFESDESFHVMMKNLE